MIIRDNILEDRFAIFMEWNMKFKKIVLYKIW